MFLNDSLQVFTRALAIPGAFGIDKRNRAVETDAQALGLRTKHTAFYVDELQLLEPFFQEGPGAGLFLLVGASASDTQEDVALNAFEFELFRHTRERLVEIHRVESTMRCGEKKQTRVIALKLRHNEPRDRTVLPSVGSFSWINAVQYSAMTVQ